MPAMRGKTIMNIASKRVKGICLILEATPGIFISSTRRATMKSFGFIKIFAVRSKAC